MTVVKPSSEDKRETVTTWLDSLGISHDPCEPDDDQEWEMFTQDGNGPPIRVGWCGPPADSITFRLDISVPETAQRAYGRLGAQQRMVFAVDLSSRMARSSVHGQVFVEADDEEDETEQPDDTLSRPPDFIKLSLNLIADDGVSRSRFFADYHEMRNTANRVLLLFRRLTIKGRWEG